MSEGGKEKSIKWIKSDKEWKIKRVIIILVKEWEGERVKESEREYIV